MATGPHRVLIVDDESAVCAERTYATTPDILSPAAAENAWRGIARLARPLVIAILAALAFAALLRCHHTKFEDGVVRSFQKQQLDATRSWATGGSPAEDLGGIGKEKG